MLDLVQLARSTFFYNCKPKVDKYIEIKAMIKSIFFKHKERYGHRRIYFELKKWGITVNKKCILKLMNEMELKPILMVKNYSSYRGSQGKIMKNLLKRNFKASMPFEKLVTDVTEFKVGNKKIYLSPIIDLFNNEVIAYHVGKSPNLKQITRMMKGVLLKLPKGAKPILHSDQGWQYQHVTYQTTLKEAGIKQSMSRKGNCIDNGAGESFFGRLKIECFYKRKFANIRELMRAIHQFIRYYNEERIQERLNGLSPVEYRKQSLNF